MSQNEKKYSFKEIEKILEKVVENESLDKQEGIRILAEELGLDELSAPLFWRALIELLKEKGKGGIVDKEFINNTLFDIIQKDIDYDAILFQDNELLLSDFYIGHREREDFWNESINQLIKKVKELNNLEEVELQKSANEQHNITSETLRQADAANAFQSSEPLVVPYYNIDDKNYREIRSDSIEKKQNNSNKLQTTQNKNALEEKIEDWIRLLMPRYGRRVELEDLDRNFWVIGQSLSAIGSYVFEKSLFSDGIESILKEIIQLWENIIYLWMNIAIASQKTEKEFQLIFYHLGASEFDNFTKFNNIPKISCKENFVGVSENYKVKNVFELKEQKVYNFSNNFNQNNLEEIDEISRLTILGEQFSNQKLCVVPIKRVNNYYKNYFSGEWYDYLYVHAGIKKEDEKYEKDIWKKIKIKECIGQKGGEFITNDLVISPRYDRCVEYNGKTYYRFTPFIFGVHTFQDDTFVYGYPFFDAKNYTLNDEDNHFFYCALRTEPIIDINITQDGEIEIKDFRIRVYDGYSKLICNEEHLIGEYFLIDSQVVNENEELILGFRYSQKCIDIYSKYKYLPPKSEKLWINNYYSNYLGEIPSWRNNAQSIVSILDEKMVENNAIFLKIGNFLPIYEEGNYTFAHTQNGKIEQYFMDFTRVQTNYQTNYQNNPLGFYSYYNFEKDRIENYQISNDLKSEDTPFNSEPNFISLQVLKQYSNENKLNRDCIKKISDSTVRDFIIQYYSQSSRKDLFRGKSCFFITGIGLEPTQKNLEENNFEWIYDVNALCFAYHFIPNQKYLDYSNKIIDKNYINAYDACKEIFLIKDGEEEIGKIISCGEINGYDSFYDYISDDYDFKNRMINIDGNFYEADLSGNKRKKLEVIFNGDKIELQKIKGDDEESVSYIPNFEEELNAEVIYYDLLNSDYNTNRFDVSDVIEAPALQISSGKIRIDQFEENQIKTFNQEENGDIKKLNNELFKDRNNSCQKRNLNTSLPFANNKEEPFKNYSETIINDYNKYTDFDESFYEDNYIIGREKIGENSYYALLKKPENYTDNEHKNPYWQGKAIEESLIYQGNEGLILLKPDEGGIFYKSSPKYTLKNEIGEAARDYYNIHPKSYAEIWENFDEEFSTLPNRIRVNNVSCDEEQINIIISKKFILNQTVKHSDKAAYYYFYKNIKEILGVNNYDEGAYDEDINEKYCDLIVSHENNKFKLYKRNEGANDTELSFDDKGIEVGDWEDAKADILYNEIMNDEKQYYLCQYVKQEYDNTTELLYFPINKIFINKMKSEDSEYSVEQCIKQILKNRKITTGVYHIAYGHRWIEDTNKNTYVNYSLIEDLSSIEIERKREFSAEKISISTSIGPEERNITLAIEVENSVAGYFYPNRPFLK